MRQATKITLILSMPSSVGLGRVGPLGACGALYIALTNDLVQL